MNTLKKMMLLVSLTFIMLTATAAAADKLPIFVSIVPQAYFVEQIGQDLVDVQVMVQPGASPATYEPKPRQMAALTNTSLYFAIGVPFENTWLDKIAAVNPDMRVIHTDHDIEKLKMAAHHHDDHHQEADHGHHEDKHPSKTNADDHDHTGLDPHIWLAPPLVKIQAQTMLTALQEVDPKNRDVYAANFKAFSAQIDQLHIDLKKIFAEKNNLQFMVFHPAWGYFAHTYGLNQVPIELEGKNPKPAQLQELIQHAKKLKINVIFVQPQFSTKSAKVIAREIGGEVVFADPLAKDWMSNLRDVAGKFQAALK